MPRGRYVPSKLVSKPRESQTILATLACGVDPEGDSEWEMASAHAPFFTTCRRPPLLSMPSTSRTVPGRILDAAVSAGSKFPVRQRERERVS